MTGYGIFIYFDDLLEKYGIIENKKINKIKKKKIFAIR